MAALGSRMHELSFSVRGIMDESEWRLFLSDLVKAIGMTPAGMAAHWEYPTQGKGGVGITIVQPLTESAVLVDTWPEHKGAYVRVSSCKDFDHVTARDMLERYGLTILDTSYTELAL